MLSRYLRYGCSERFPYVDNSEITDLTYHEIKDQLNALITEAIRKINPLNTVFQLSGGFDSSVVVSHFKGVDTFCTGDENSLDRTYSAKVSKEFGTNHTWMSHKSLLNEIDFKKTVIEMASINRHPRCFKNDFGLFAFLKYIKEHADRVVGGKGIEFQMLGYCTIYNRILEHAIGTGEYSVGKAESYLLKRTVNSTKDMMLFNVQNVLESYRNPTHYSLNHVDWWTGTFDMKDVERLTYTKQKDHSFDNLTEIIDFIFEWFGREYIDNRLEDYGKYFGVECVNPYMDDAVVNFIKTIPVEMKKCMNHHKYIFYEAMAHKVPGYIVERPKEGLNTSLSYFESHEGDIAELVVEYLLDKSMKIYNHIDYDELKSVMMNFNKTWMLLNLSIWMEHNASN